MSEYAIINTAKTAMIAAAHHFLATNSKTAPPTYAMSSNTNATIACTGNSIFPFVNILAMIVMTSIQIERNANTAQRITSTFVVMLTLVL